MTIFFIGDQEAVEGDAGDNRQAVGPGADDGRQLLHERSTSFHGQMERRGPEDRGGRRGTAIAYNRYRATAAKRRFVTHVRPRGVPRRVTRRRFTFLVKDNSIIVRTRFRTFVDQRRTHTELRTLLST